MIPRRLFLAAGTFAFIRPARAELRSGSYRIGHLSSSSPARTKETLAPFRAELSLLGYEEGKNLVLDIRTADGKYELLPGLAAELAALRPDVIYAWTTPSLMAMHRLNAGIPVVFAGIGPDPVGLGVVQSIRRPGGDFTGITNSVSEITPKRLEMLRELLPGATRIAFFANSANPSATPAFYQRLDNDAAKVGFGLLVTDVRSAEEFPGAFAKAAELKADALLGSADPLSASSRGLIIRLAAEYKLPVIYNFPFEADDGGLISYGPDLDAQYRRAAVYVDKVLRGEKTADLPVEQAAKLALVVNLKTARALGLSIPPLLLARADRVVE